MYSTSLSQNIGDLIEKDFATLDENTTIVDGAKVMKDRGISSVLVRGTSGPVGIITERDIIYRAVAENKDLLKTTLKEIMGFPLVTIYEESSVATAISLMRERGIRRLPVKNANDTIIGIVTLMSIVGNSPSYKVDLAEIEVPHNTNTKITIRCPYCQSTFEEKDQLSKHIDGIHLGSGLLEGDMRKWQ